MALPAAGVTRSGPAVLQVRGLSVDYGPVAALHDVDLDVQPGELVGIAGDNGAGKSTLLRCVCGDVEEARGTVWLDGEPMTSPRPSGSPGQVGVVWQHLVLSDNLDAAATLMLGRERHRMLMSDARFHARARAILEDLGIVIPDPGRPVGALTASQRQLLAIARSVTPRPRLLLLDEPTAALNRAESVHVVRLIRRFHDEGTTMVLISHDVEQLLRLTDRVVVLRHGTVVAQVDPVQSHPDELLALMAGHDPSSAPRHQLTRLHGLADQLTSADRPATGDPTVGLTLILTTLGTALDAEQLSLHLVAGDTLAHVTSVGLTAPLERTWQRVSVATDHGPLSRAVTQASVAVAADVRQLDATPEVLSLVREAGIESWWAVPFSGRGEVMGVISVFRPVVGPPGRDELDLVNLYAGYAAAAVERDRLLAEVTARNTRLETIRSVLQTLAGPGRLSEGLGAALRTLRESVGADEVGLYGRAEGEETSSARGFAGGPGTTYSSFLAARAEVELARSGDPAPSQVEPDGGGSVLLVRLPEPGAATVLAARWSHRVAGTDERLLFEDAAHSILLALERERGERARRETTALRRSRELQRQFLARLSHELRTPLTAIRGYASSLMQTDVTWDAASQQRFLTRISSESARLRRLVDDLLDFSTIESGVLRIRPDWVDLPLVVDAARSCLAPAAAAAIEIHLAPGLPAVWADHDRLEQVMMNLMDNAVRHNPDGTRVRVGVRRDGADAVVIEVCDDGIGALREPGAPPWVDRAARRSPTAGAGLGLSITRGIVEAHHGTLRQEPAHPGTRFVVHLPVEADVPAGEAADV